MKLKTLNDITLHSWEREMIKAEAIKWVKFGKNPNGDQQIFTREEWMEFFNITEEDLK